MVFGGFGGDCLGSGFPWWKTGGGFMGLTLRSAWWFDGCLVRTFLHFFFYVSILPTVKAFN